MRIFEYPYVIISIIVICFFLLGSIGIYFAVRGLKTANDEEEYDFTNIRKLESSFEKSGKRRDDRCLMYISVFLDNYRSLYSESQTEKVFLAIRRILLNSFSIDNTDSIATYGEYTYVVYTTLDMDSVRSKIESFQTVLTKCLLDHGALNIAEVHIGAFFAFGSLQKELFDLDLFFRNS